MRAELPLFSFLSLALLLLILPGQLKSNTIPAVSVIAWLFICNIIHGVNSILWADNVALHAPAWCDLATVLLLGAMVAVPGAFLCISRQLDLITTRTESGLKPSQRYRKLFEISMCIFLPVVYMSLHTIVQDYRFSIVRDLGCQAAVYSSLPALILVWLPPLIISGVALCYCLSAAINVGKSRYTGLSFFPFAPDMTTSLFCRRLVFASVSMLYVVTVYVITVSTVTSAGRMQTWTSISQARAHIKQIEILGADTTVRLESELIWWSIPIWSLLLCIMSAFGEETRNGYRSMSHWFSRRLGGEVLPTHSKFVSTEPTTPIHLLKSGWDDALNIKKSQSTLRSNFTIRSKSGSTRSSTPSPPLSPEQDASFTQSTLNYLDSDAARQLRLPSPPPAVQFQVPAKSPVSHAKEDSIDMLIPPNLSLDPPSPSGESPTSSILSANAWPQPPPVHPYARSGSPTSVRSSVTSSVTVGRADPVAPPRMRTDLPFSVDGPSVQSVPFVAQAPRRSTSSHQPRGRSQHRSPPRLAKSKKSAQDVIYMTVVKETVVGDS